MKEPFAAKASPKTLKQQLQENCTTIIKTEYPCDNCYGCQTQLDIIKSWLTQKQPKTTDENTLIRYNCIKELLEELNQ